MKKIILLFTFSVLSIQSYAATCENKIPFNTWLQQFKADAVSQGISKEVLQQTSHYLVVDPNIIKRDRNQSVFQQTFLQFSDRMANEGRRIKAQRLITKDYKQLFEKVEREYGVPAYPIAAFWALESDFGAVTGKFPILTAVTTLAYDCRRSDKFRKQALDALKLIQRGDLKPEEMIGNWAGELGGTQFMPSDYFESGVDYDQDGKVNLVKSIPDTIATAANYLAKKGWKAGEPWMKEVKVPTGMKWEEADITIAHPVSYWVKAGVKPVVGEFKNSDLLANLVLPMGRLGPAFLVYPNFHALLQWNESVVYSTTAGYMASLIAGASRMQRGSDSIKHLNVEQVTELQELLIRRGHDIGEPDGKAGTKTKAAVRKVQLQLNMPADAYPTLELLEALRK